MHSIRINGVITLIICFFYRTGVWHRGDQPTIKQFRIKLFYCVYYFLFLLSLVVGVIKNDKRGADVIFLAEVTIGIAVVYAKLWLLVWKQGEILSLLNRVCVFSIRNDDDNDRYNDQLRGFMKFVFVFVINITVSGGLVSIVLSLFGSEKILFFQISFPLDYRSNDIAYWIAFVFQLTEVLLTIVIIYFSIIIWYLLLTCSLRYEVLANELRNMGRSIDKRNGKRTERQIIFLQDLKMSIDAHLQLRELVNDVESFFSGLFFTQFGTSGLCICGSIYCLAFDIGNNLSELILYFLSFVYFNSELFMITYFGNEIMLKSDRLCYSLFESDWYNQPQSTKKCIIIFGECLKQPQQLVIGKLYPLTLETFTRILNSAYSMFNILKSFE